MGAVAHCCCIKAVHVLGRDLGAGCKYQHHGLLLIPYTMNSSCVGWSAYSRDFLSVDPHDSTMVPERLLDRVFMHMGACLHASTAGVHCAMTSPSMVLVSRAQ